MNLNWVCYKFTEHIFFFMFSGGSFKMCINTLHLQRKHLLELDAVESPLTATILQWPIYSVPLDRPYINYRFIWTSLQRSPIHIGNVTKVCSRPTVKITSRQGPVILATDLKAKNGHEMWFV